MNFRDVRKVVHHIYCMIQFAESDILNEHLLFILLQSLFVSDQKRKSGFSVLLSQGTLITGFICFSVSNTFHGNAHHYNNCRNNRHYGEKRNFSFSC